MSLYVKSSILIKNYDVSKSFIEYTYVYKIQFKTGDFYIGQTENIKQRIAHHFYKIINVIMGDNNIDTFHKKIGTKLKVNDINSRENSELLLKESMSVIIIKICKNKKEALALEKYYISNNLFDNNSLNKKIYK
jgi:hypothetical protein